MNVIVYKNDYLRVRWNGEATFNIQIEKDEGWTDIECFTIYFDAIDREDMARTLAKQHIEEHFGDTV